jgi:dolichol-phosphate mannosyltransferase
MLLSIIVPVYNEENTIKNSFLNLKLSLNKNKIFKYEIIFVNDSSYDESERVLLELKKKYKNIKILNNKTNLGFAKTIIKGFLSAKGNYCHILPADNEHPHYGLGMIHKFIKKDYDLIIPSVKNTQERNFFRRSASKVYTKLLNFFFKLNVPYFNGIIIYKTKFIKQVIKIISNNSFSILAEILIRVLHLNKNVRIKFTEYLLFAQKNRKSNSFNFRSLIKVTLGLSKLYYDIILSKYYFSFKIFLKKIIRATI